ncbi:MAG: DNA polymerase-3 subunit gamma/tau [Halieaceae bacterium]|jgi:DNA polymerase-3 subunit gamma/tau
MSYQVLARKWRPKSFREMVGQEHVLQALINALDHDRLHHAYLFTGTRGVGKTTIARILAKCLNCEAGVSSEPCGVCGSCIEVAEGRCIDLLEVDAASQTKVEQTRELLDNVQYLPTRGRYKVYLIDEVHMLSGHSFNALLKTLEEPPPHVKFLLATTDPQKLPATVLSRCLQFNLKNMPPEQISGHLGFVLGKEMIKFEEPALWLLGRAAAGSMRDALSLTDQAIAFGSGAVSEADVRTMLGTVDLDFVYQLLEAVATGEPKAALEVAARMAEHAPDFEGSLNEVISLLHRVAVAQTVPSAIDNSWGDAARVEAISQSFTAEDTQLFYQTAINGKRDLAFAADPRSGFEMILLRMIAFRPVAVLDSALKPEDLVQGEQAVAPISAVEVGAPVKKPPEALPVAAPTATADIQITQAVLETKPQHVPEPELEPLPEPVSGAAIEQASQAAPAETPRVPAAHPPEVSSAVGSSLSPDNWADTVDSLGLIGSVANVASNCELRSTSGDSFEFVLDETNAALFNQGHVEKIRLALENYCDAPITINITTGTVAVETPALKKARLALERQQQAVDDIECDQVLQSLIERFDGKLDRASIVPLDN